MSVDVKSYKKIMSTEIINFIEDGNHMVGAQNDPETDYVLWQKLEEESEIYFEYCGQQNSGYDIVQEITIDRDGIHIVVKTGELVHFYFNQCKKEDWEKMVSGLKEVYSDRPKVLEIL